MTSPHRLSSRLFVLLLVYRVSFVCYAVTTETTECSQLIEDSLAITDVGAIVGAGAGFYFCVLSPMIDEVESRVEKAQKQMRLKRYVAENRVQLTQAIARQQAIKAELSQTIWGEPTDVSGIIIGYVDGEKEKKQLKAIENKGFGV
jgi:acid stress-induced BolA-like protein IbaG/YrbA